MGYHFPSPGDLPGAGIEPCLLHAGEFFSLNDIVGIKFTFNSRMIAKLVAKIYRLKSCFYHFLAIKFWIDHGSFLSVSTSKKVIKSALVD